MSQTRLEGQSRVNRFVQDFVEDARDLLGPFAERLERVWDFRCDFGRDIGEIIHPGTVGDAAKPSVFLRCPSRQNRAAIY